MLSSWFGRNLIANTALRRTISTTVVKVHGENANNTIEYRNISKDRTQQIPVETGIKYLKSLAYQQTYGNQLVWVLYRRNFKGGIPPRKTRRTCIRAGQISAGNPCPICRDEYLVLHEDNVDLLKQFICPHTQSVFSYSKTGLCQKKHEQLLTAITRARDKGLITFDVPRKYYDYSEYYLPDQ